MGSGYGHDAAYFGKHGFKVLGLDYIIEAVQGARARYGQYANFKQADIFELGSEYKHQFDYVLEHTCFCAISPERRLEYAKVINTLLKPGGYFIGLIWAFVEDDEPPYPSTQKEILDLFSSGFEVKNPGKSREFHC